MRKFILCLLFLLGISLAAFAQRQVDNEAVVRLVKAGLSDDLIIIMINSQPGKYATGVDDVIALKQAGVSDKILRAMLSKGQPGGDAPPQAQSPAPQQPARQELVLRDGTPVRLRLNRNLSSADAKVGETVDFEVLDEINIGDTLVIRKGAIAIGTVTQAQHKRRMARGGRLDVTIDYVRLLSEDKVALRGVRETSGGGHTGAMTGGIVATSLIIWPAAPFFLFMHGKDVTIPKGTEITAYVNGDLRIDPSRLPKH